MATQLPRLLFIIDYYHPHIGGLEVVFENIITRLAKQGYSIGILTSKHIPTLPAYEKMENNIEIRRVGKNRNTFLWYALRWGRKIIDRYDIIHTTTYAGAIPGSILGKRYNKKTILTVHEIFGPKLRRKYKPYRRRLYQWFEQIIFWFPYTYTICVSKYTKRMLNTLYKIPNKTLQVIYNGIDTNIRQSGKQDQAFTENFLNTHKLHDKYILFYYGHSGASKGLTYLIRALPSIIKTYPDAVLVLNMIPGKRDHTILKLIKKLKLTHSIILLQGVLIYTLRDLINLSDVAIVPSISDGFGLVAAEVSALGHPLIVTRNGSLPEVVSGKIVFLEKYSSQGFIDAIEKIKQKNREKIPKKIFDREKTIENYRRLY